MCNGALEDEYREAFKSLHQRIRNKGIQRRGRTHLLVFALQGSETGTRLPEGSSVQEAERLVGSGGCEAGSEVGLTQATLGQPRSPRGDTRTHLACV
jgi:hypothetical protein